MRTVSYTNGRADHECFPDSGPNIGCVHSKSVPSGSAADSSVLGYSLTDSTSTTNFPLRRSFGKVIKTDRRATIATANTITSINVSAKSAGSWANLCVFLRCFLGLRGVCKQWRLEMTLRSKLPHGAVCVLPLRLQQGLAKSRVVCSR